MSGLGILASALGGGAAAIGEQAKGDIAQQREMDMAKQKADIEEQMRMRLAEFSENLRQKGVLADNTGPLADAKLGYAKREGEQRTQQAIDQARGMIPVTQEAAKATAQTQDEIVKARAGDKDYLNSVATIKLADPEVKAHLAQMAAAAGASAAQTRMLGEQLKQLQAVGSVAEQVRGLQQKLSSAKTEDERSTIQQQITDLGFNGKDTKGFLTIAERAMNNGDAALKVLNDPTASPEAKASALTQLNRANEFADKAAAQAGLKLGNQAAASGGPAIGSEVNGYVFKGGNPNDKKNWEPKKGGGMIPATAQAVSTNKAPDYQPMSDGSGRMVDTTTGRTLTAEQSAVLVKIQRGEPTTPRERALLND